MAALRLLLLAAAVLLNAAAPVEQSLQDTLQEEEDMLLLLVPSVPIEKRSALMDEKDVEYDLIAIPGEVLRREVKQSAQNFGQLEQTLLAAGLKASLTQPNDRSGTATSTNEGAINTNQDLNINTNQGFNINSNQDTQFHASEQPQQAQDGLHNSLLSGHDDLTENNHDKRSFFPTSSTSSSSSSSSSSSDDGFEIGDFAEIFNKNSNSNTNSNSNNNNQDILRTVGSAISTKASIAAGVGRVVAKFGGGANQNPTGLGNLKSIIKSKLNLPGGGTSSNQNNILGNVGQAFALGGSVVGGLSKVLGKLGNNGESNSGLGGLGGLGNLGGNIISGIRDLKEGGRGSAASGLQSFTEAATGGFRYVGRLSTSLLRILLQIPGIKARVFTEIVQAGTPLKTAVSDVIGENADDMRTLIEAGTEIIRDAFDVVIKLVSDVLALKGRMLASFGANGLDAGSSLFDGGLRIGGALVQSAGDVASAVGRGVGEVVQVVSESDIPPLPQLPNLQLPNLGGLFNLGGGGSSGGSSGSGSHRNSKELFNLFGRKRR